MMVANQYVNQIRPASREAGVGSHGTKIATHVPIAPATRAIPSNCSKEARRTGGKATPSAYRGQERTEIGACGVDPSERVVRCPSEGGPRNYGYRSQPDPDRGRRCPHLGRQCDL